MVRLSSGEAGAPAVHVKVEKSGAATGDETNPSQRVVAKKPDKTKTKAKPKKRKSDGMSLNTSVQSRCSSRLASRLATQKISSMAKQSMGKVINPRKIKASKPKKV